MTSALPWIEARPLVFRDGALYRQGRAIPEEAPVALTYDGSAYAVMMATPANLTDFAIGFSFSEGVIGAISDIESLEIVDVDGGFEARIWLNPQACERHRRKRRILLGPTGCGLCGVESIEEALKPLPPVDGTLTVSPDELCTAMASLPSSQHLHLRTAAVHAAGLFRPKTSSLLVREDVGRHNALDKLIGAVLQQEETAQDAVVLLTSRVSVELVQKTARLGASIIAAISAPTGLAVRAAEDAGITLAAIVRGENFEIFSHPGRIVEKARANVA